MGCTNSKQPPRKTVQYKARPSTERKEILDQMLDRNKDADNINDNKDNKALNEINIQGNQQEQVIQSSVSFNCIINAEDTESIGLEQEPSIPIMNKNIIMDYKQSNIILLQRSESSYFENFFKAIQDEIYVEQNLPQFQNWLSDTNQQLLQELHLKENFINQYGLFRLLMEGLKDKDISLLMESSDYKNQKANDYRGNKKYYNMKAQIDLQQLCFLGTNFSHKKFSLIFNEDQIISLQNLKDSFNLQQKIKESLKNQINKQLQNLNVKSDIIWQRISQIENNQFQIEFILPYLKCSMQDTFMKNLTENLKDEQKNLLQIQIKPIIKFFFGQYDLVESWRNFEFEQQNSKSDSIHPQNWKLFGIKSNKLTDDQQYDSLGYINIFKENANQEDLFDLKSEDVVVVKNFKVFMDYKFAEPKKIEISVQGEKKWYQLLFKVKYRSQNMRSIRSGDNFLDQNIILAQSNSISLQGILVMNMPF